MTDHLAPPPARPADQPPATAVSPWFAWPALLLTAGPSFVTLAHFQHELFAAKWAAAPWFVTFGMALAVDFLGITAGVYWFRSPARAALRSWGRFFAIAAVLGSTALTCWGIALLHGSTAAPLGLVPATVVFVATKLVTLWQADRATARVTDRVHTAALVVAEQRAAAAETRAAELAEQAAALRARLDIAPAPRRLHAVPASQEVAEQDDTDTGPIDVVPAGVRPTGDLFRALSPAEQAEHVAEWIRTVDGPTGQRPAAHAFDVSRAQIADPHRAALDLVAAETAATGT